jgi:antimicrobial peptide system SdpA family protein
VNARSDHAAAWRTAMLAGVMGLVGATGLFAAIDTGLPFSPLRPISTPSTTARHFAPQGWAFFTRDPLEPQIYVYRRTEAGWIAADIGANGEPAHLFGWRRSPRAQGVEIGLVLFAHGKEQFTACEGSIEECLETSPIEGTVQNDSTVPTLCGTIGILRQKKIPWAWRHSVDPERAPAEVMNLEVSC